jgi:hypothetical protein
MKSFIFILALLVSLSVQSASIELEWFIKDDTNVKDYRLIFGTQSGLTVSTKTGKVNNITVDTLSEG